MEKNVPYILCFLTYVLPSSISLGWDFYKLSDLKSLFYTGIIFLGLSTVVILSKLAFDFLLVMMISRFFRLSLKSQETIDILIRNMLWEGVFVIISILICSLFFDDFSHSMIMAHTVINTFYYYLVGNSVYRITCSRKVLICLLVLSLVSWITLFGN